MANELSMAEMQAIIAINETADGISNALLGTLVVASDTAVALIWNTKNKTPQAVCDILSKNGRLESLYNRLAYAQGLIAQLWPGQTFAMSPFEVIPYRDENKVFHLLVTEVPFDMKRDRFEEQASLEDAQALAAENKPDLQSWTVAES
ncbi:MAG: hypothetical protein LBV12_06345 [Puniceicoccales bacterium]|jgi:hypothetical protein|nr:hypothetical protein [Puniceicoccales bacterium]